MADEAVEIPIEPVDDKVEVKIDDKPVETRAETKTPVVTAEEGIESLKAQVEKAKRESAERLALADRKIAEAHRQAQEAQREVVTTKRDQVGTIIDKLTMEKDTARRDYRAAMEAGDFDKAAEAQERIATAAARIVKAEEGKFALEEEAKKPVVVQSADDPVERLARSMSSARSANWIRQHPEVVVNGSLSPAAMSAHYDALAQGHAADSDAYFQHIEGRLSGGGPRPQPRQERTETTTGRDMNRAPVSAPVGRDIVQAPGASRPNSLRLEPHEVQTALDTYSPLYPKESREQLLQRYAKDKLALMDEGKITRRAS